MSKPRKIQLSILGLPVVENMDELSRILHVSKYTIYQLSKLSSKHYRTFEIPKKSGGKRLISQPSKRLKALQSWILVHILNKLQVSQSCKGFRIGTSIVDNVNPHIGANTVLSIDIKDFFPSISSIKVYNIFRSIGYNNLISTVFTNLCTYDDHLPQGSPCSPILANLSLWNLDLRIQGYVGKRGITYTRYADDLTFSGLNPSKVVNIIPMVKKIIIDESHEVNDRKTRVSGSARRKIITGLVLHENTIGIGKRKYKSIRSKVFQLAISNSNSDINKIIGWISYLNSVDKPRLIRLKKHIKDLSEKYNTASIIELHEFMSKSKFS
jgi:RNA-directed DNA polymerase